MCTVAEGELGVLFNGSNATMRHGVMRAHFAGLDWEYERSPDGPQYLRSTTGRCSERVTLMVSNGGLLSFCSMLAEEYSFILYIDVLYCLL